MDEVAQPQMGLNFEQVWAALMESRREFDRRMQETDRLIKESQQETARLIKENAKQMKQFHSDMGDLGKRFGELAEHLIIPNIAEKFNALGYHFKFATANSKLFNDETRRVEAEFDILLENGGYIIGVEVKTKPNRKDVDDHIKRLALLRKYKNEEGDKKVIQGAIAGAIIPKNVREAALEAGLYVIEQSGDTVKIEKPPAIRGW
jgi:hypothetical protein